MRLRNQPATYWPPAAADRFGAATYGAPLQILCRWEDRAELFRDDQAREAISSAVVYPDQALALRGKLVQGHTADAAPPADAREIRQIGSSPNLQATRQLHKVWL